MGGVPNARGPHPHWDHLGPLINIVPSPGCHSRVPLCPWCFGRSLWRGAQYGKKYCHNFVWKFANIVRLLDRCLGDDVNEGIDDGVPNDMFDAWDVEAQGESAPKQRFGHGVASKQSGQSTFSVNRAMLQDLATKQRTKWGSMPKIWRTRTNSQLQCNMEAATSTPLQAIGDSYNTIYPSPTGEMLTSFSFFSLH